MSIDEFDLVAARVNSGYGPTETATTAPSTHYVNEAGLPDDEFADVVGELRANRDIASQIEKWSASLNADLTAQPSIDVFNRSRWQGKRHVFAQMSQAAWAVENDDVLSTLADVTEGLSFDKCRFELFDEDQQDFWNQWAADFDMDSVLRRAFRELYKCSQFYAGLWWERAEYPVRDKPIADTLDELEKVRRQKAYDDHVANPPTGPDGQPVPPPPNPAEDRRPRGNRRRKKVFSVEVPTAMTIFDPTKILPVGTLMFGRERFAYIADRTENESFGQVVRGEVLDPTVNRLVERRYNPTPAEVNDLNDMGLAESVERLWLLREDACFRHTLTRAEYERFSSVRLRAVFPIMEMKAHLRDADRAMLVGMTNFLVVITKGTDKLPAKQAEIDNLREQSRVIARLPVLVGDHRLHVEIVAPPIDNTLIESRWQVLDSRLVFKALQTFMPIVQGGNSSAGVSEMSRVVSQGLENRRHMLVRSFERQIFKQIVARNKDLDERPTLAFSPKHITLDFKADVVNAILKLRDRGDISRETMLEELDFDQENEALRRAREKGLFDEVFSSQVPFGSPQTNPFAAGGTPPPAAGTQGPPAPGGAGGGTGAATPLAPRAPGRPAGSKDRQPRAARGSGGRSEAASDQDTPDQPSTDAEE